LRDSRRSAHFHRRASYVDPQSCAETALHVRQFEERCRRRQVLIKNRLSDATLIGIHRVKIDGLEAPEQALSFDLGGGQVLAPDQISPKNPLDFPLRKTIEILARIDALTEGKHHLEIDFETKPLETKFVKKRKRLPAWPSCSISTRISRANLFFCVLILLTGDAAGQNMVGAPLLRRAVG
jgi:hypothetical protein